MRVRGEAERESSPPPPPPAIGGPILRRRRHRAPTGCKQGPALPRVTPGRDQACPWPATHASARGGGRGRGAGAREAAGGERGSAKKRQASFSRLSPRAPGLAREGVFRVARVTGGWRRCCRAAGRSCAALTHRSRKRRVWRGRETLAFLHPRRPLSLLLLLSPLLSALHPSVPHTQSPRTPPSPLLHVLHRMSLSCTTVNFSPAGVSRASPAYLK